MVGPSVPFQLTHLPLSFHRLTSLRWLDLKNNQLSSQLAAAAGECLNPKECEQCARRVVQFMGRVKEHYDQERIRRQQHEKGGPAGESRELLQTGGEAVSGMSGHSRLGCDPTSDSIPTRHLTLETL